MRKYIVLLLLFCLHTAARGQTLEEIDLSGLPQPTQAKSLRYWFDSDKSSLKTVNNLANNQTVDVSKLSEGLHTIHYQVVDNANTVGETCTGVFVKVGQFTVSSSKTLLYSFDNETSVRQMALSSGTMMLDASALEIGLHTIHYQVEYSDGMVTPPMTSMFIHTHADGETSGAKSFHYWFDNEQNVHTANVNGGIHLLDVSALSDGIHTVHYQITDASDMPGAPASSLFMKTEQQSAQSIRYWFDNETSATVTTMASGTQSIDVAHLRTGMHTIHYQVVDNNGKTGAPVSCLFLKDFDKVVEGGVNKIVNYQYWLNDNWADMKTVTVSQASNPYQLISLLPLTKEPFRSSLFHFEVTNGVPAVYAKNVFNIRFNDAKGFFSDDQKAFIDYRVKQAVEPVGELQVTQSFDRIAENDIRWYTLNVEQGDTVAFKTNQACSIQLFSPTGKEVYSAMGSTSVTYGGCHIWESGTYYLAIHDVTGYQGYITLDYMHMDKYDVVRQDINVVGNGGCSTITFEGNGFRDLYSVDLYNERGDTIHFEYIGHESDAITSIVFDFNEVETTTYDAIFHFATEDRIVKKAIKVENFIDITLKSNVVFANSFLVSSEKAVYTINIENEGNMTSYRTPIYLYIASKTPNGISRVNISGLELDGVFDGVDLDSLSDSDRKQLKSIANEIGDTHYFIQLAKYDEATGDSIYVMSGYFFADIAPLSLKTINVTITTQNQVELWCKIPSANNPLLSDIINENASASRRITREEYCCIREKVECIAGVVADIAGLAKKFTSIAPNTPADIAASIADCLASGINTIIKATGNIMCGNTSEIEMSLWEQLKMIKDGISGISAIGKCAKNFLPAGQLKVFLDAIMNFTGGNLMTSLDLHLDGFSCLSAFTEKKSNCPPCTSNCGGGGVQTPVQPLDPNDIYGYTAESGSHAVMDGQNEVYYAIEFENDPEFATASAHDIYLTNTLDATKFDLSTFKPTCVNIGSKSAELSGDKNFVTTIDMRPEINAIAQVEGTYDENTGTARWHISSLDPMTMEPTEEVMDGVLPVNYGGNGIGEVMYDIQLKPGLAHQTKVSNQASIVFDKNEVIQTPVWTNIIDRIAPTSHATEAKMLNDSTASVSIAATDELSGPWRYDVYVQYGDGAWFLGAENVPIDQKAKVKVYQGINHGFYTVVTDSAGNVEQKQATREFTLDVFSPQIETTTKLQLAEGWNWISQNQNTALSAETLKPKAQRIVSQTEELYKDARLGWSGDLTELQPTEMYKVQMSSAASVQLSGLLYNASFRTVPLRKGWNWMGYPVAKTMTPNEALAKLEAEENDALIGQDGMAQYSGGRWTGTLTTMQPGQGYMYRSTSDKELFLNATAQASSRSNFAQSIVPNPPIPEDWTVDKHHYPNIMGIVAELNRNGQKEDADDWTVGAFAGEECRGVAQNVNGRLMMNVYGQGGEQIVFRAMYRESGEVVTISEQEAFRADLLGSVSEPYQLTIGTVTGIVDNERMRSGENEERTYDLQGRRVNSQTSKGIYIVTDGKKSRTQKVVKK